MVKETRGGKRAGGGASFTGELTLPDGSKIEYDGTLKYGGNDKAVSGAARQAVSAWEQKRGKNKIEYAMAFNADGTPIISEARGGSGSVRVPWKAHTTPNSIFTHVHPREAGGLGGTFSGADMSNFANYGNKTLRAKAKEGTYSITKGSNFEKNAFMGYVNKVEGEFTKRSKQSHSQIMADIRSNKISYTEGIKRSQREFNTNLVQLHNDYLAGQKQYGYTYTLEK